MRKALKSALLVMVLTMWGVESLAGEITDLEDCYGETLEIKMPSKFGDGIETEYTYFSLPAPNAWLVNIGDGKLLDDVPCQANGDLSEPVPSRNLWGGFFDPRLGHERKTLEVDGGIRLHTLRITSPNFDSIVRQEAWWLDNVLSLATKNAEGYLRRPSVEGDAVGGTWSFPESYLSPVGTRIRMGCALTCDIEYRIDRNLKIRYQLQVPDRNRDYDWIEIDRVARKVVLGWITD
ncbi:MAG: hypothetical protein AAF557_20150 [Pseudomonadota bacterium]